jgi:hypothetical protein
VYWEEGQAYFRGPKDGSGPKERLSDSERVLMGRGIQTDEQFIYLKREAGVEVLAKDGSSRLLVEPPMPWGSTGAFDVIDGRIVFADATCEAFALLDGSAPRTASHDQGWVVGGGTNVIVVNNIAYCVNQSNGVRWELGSDAPVVLFNLSDAEFSFTAMAASASELFLINYGIAGLPQALARLPVPTQVGRSPEYWCTGDRGSVVSLHFDPARNALYWPRQEASEPLDLRSCSLDSPKGGPTVQLTQYQSLGDDTHGFDGDATHFYWVDEFGVWRAPKPPL